MTVVNFTKKQNVLTVGSVIFGEAESTDSRAMGFWTDARTLERTNAISKKLFFKTPFHDRNPTQKE